MWNVKQNSRRAIFHKMPLPSYKANIPDHPLRLWMLQCCLKTHKENMTCTPPKNAPNTPIRMIELIDAQASYHLYAKNIYILMDLLRKCLIFDMDCLKFYLFHISWVRKYIVHYLHIVLFPLCSEHYRKGTFGTVLLGSLGSKYDALHQKRNSKCIFPNIQRAKVNFLFGW